jgi:two-component system KDP operon response regulator KdpE
MSGKDALSELRGWSTVPVIILSVRADEREKVKALDVGANDYVTKPFDLQKFLARVRSLLRTRIADGAPTGIYDDGFLRIDLGKRQVTVAGENVRLTRREFDLLKMLFAHKDRVVTQTQLLRKLRGPAHTEDTHYLRIIVGRLRQKLRDDPTDPRYLITEPGAREAYAKLANALRTVANIRAAAIVLGDLAHRKTPAGRRTAGKYFQDIQIPIQLRVGR